MKKLARIFLCLTLSLCVFSNYALAGYSSSDYDEDFDDLSENEDSQENSDNDSPDEDSDDELGENYNNTKEDPDSISTDEWTKEDDERCETMFDDDVPADWDSDWLESSPWEDKKTPINQDAYVKDPGDEYELYEQDIERSLMELDDYEYDLIDEEMQEYCEEEDNEMEKYPIVDYYEYESSSVSEDIDVKAEENRETWDDEEDEWNAEYMFYMDQDDWDDWDIEDGYSPKEAYHRLAYGFKIVKNYLSEKLDDFSEYRKTDAWENMEGRIIMGAIGGITLGLIACNIDKAGDALYGGYRFNHDQWVRSCMKGADWKCCASAYNFGK
jgi:hypothetical protein